MDSTRKMPKKTAVPPRKKTLAWSLVNTTAAG
jgi:hypothetical protein